MLHMIIAAMHAKQCKNLGLLLCRGDFGIDVGRNIIHGSDGVEVIAWAVL